MKVLVIDTETELADFESKIRTCWSPPSLVAVGFTLLDGVTRQYEALRWDDKGAKQYLAARIRAADVVVFHNAQFDVGVLAKWSGDVYMALVRKIQARAVYDTKVAYRLLDPEMHNDSSLAGLSYLLLGYTLEKGAVRTSFRRDEPVTDEQMAYLRQDVEATADVYRKLSCTPPGAFSKGKYRVEVACSVPTGIRSAIQLYSSAAAASALTLDKPNLFFNRPGWDEASEYVKGEITATEWELINAGLARLVPVPKSKVTFEEAESSPYGKRWEPSLVDHRMYRRVTGGFEWKPARVQLDVAALRVQYRAAARRLGITPPLSEKTGEISLTYPFWKQFKASLPNDLRAHLRYSKAAKLRDAFLRPLAAIPDGTPIMPSYFIPGTETGRWSCARPNIQQLEKSRRNLYRATELPHDQDAIQYVFVGADYKSLELYTLAHCMHELGITGPLLEALQSGEDLHTRTAKRLFASRPDPLVRDEEYQRKVAKVCNFALAGGMGPAAFQRYANAAGLDWSKDTATRTRESWFDIYPDVRCYLERFSLSPWHFKPRYHSTAEWLNKLGFSSSQWPSSWDLRQRLDEGAWFDCLLPSGRLIPGRRYSAAANCFFQGTGADVITTAFLGCFDAGMHVAAVVHDSIICRSVRSWGKHEGDKLVKIMQDALHTVCPSVPAPLPTFEIKEVLF